MFIWSIARKLTLALAVTAMATPTLHTATFRATPFNTQLLAGNDGVTGGDPQPTSPDEPQTQAIFIPSDLA